MSSLQSCEPADDVNRCISCGTCRDCETCMQSCPEKAITRIQHLDGSFEYVSDAKNVSVVVFVQAFVLAVFGH